MKVPVEGHAYTDGYGPLRDHFCVRVRSGADLSPEDKRIGPVFETARGAQMFAAYANGAAHLNWDVNGLGMPV